MRYKIFFLIIFLLLSPPWALCAGRNLTAGTLSVQDSDITIAVLHPSLGTLQALVTLRGNGLIPFSGVSFLGLYHEKQITDYSKAREYVRANGLNWFSFYPLSGPLSEETLFKMNSCTPEFEEIFQKIDGLLFFGGPDIPPSLYQKKTSLLTEITDPYRHFLELSFVFHLLGGHQDETVRPLLDRRPEFPILAICLGSQSLNVGTGGTLVQDIWSEVYGRHWLEDVIALGRETWHVNPFFRLAPHERFSSYILHSVKLSADGKFCTAIGCKPEEEPLVISEHHQQVEKLGKGLRVIATSLDGKVAEAIEHARFPNVLGVQFHPEYPDLYTPETRVRFTPEDKEAVSLPSLLGKHSGSADFYRKLWGWVSRAWVESRHKRRGGID
ncbi:MAG: gamma-glutamyl-gamma-aminobutyrate hydrolase family protein [Candidatus Aminicenantes bacterium]|nr:gamma-glutamyl-gamma-aminobutyrate hydrolase family protein [Candidatus Aminicenantes bacterium]